jgi:SAM-dependent methyltransferase
MDRPHVDYDRLAAHYDARYLVDRLPGIGAALRELADRVRARRVLEVGCGTGRWLRELRAHGVPFVCGADASLGMLHRAEPPLAGARANSLPFRSGAFDLIFCVNALHHFDDPQAFLADAARLLSPGGWFCFIGIDPRQIRRWYLYEYFSSTRGTDLERYPSLGSLVDWMVTVGFEPIEYRVAERFRMSASGRDILQDAFLAKESNSMLALLSDAEYREGLAKIHAAVDRAEAEGGSITFAAELDFALMAGRMSARPG